MAEKYIARIQVKRGHSTALPSLHEGEFGLAEDTGELYIGTSNGTSIKVKGAQGPIGPEGPQGKQGLQGPTGPQGPRGLKGATGQIWRPIVNTDSVIHFVLDNNQSPPTSVSIKGATGATGAPGADGASIRIIGQYKDVSEVPITGNEGDLCLLNNILMKWDSSINSFVKIGEFKFETKAGPQGPQGPIGPTGTTGATGVGKMGPRGEKGHTGATGATGEIGPQGPRGIKGDVGPQGPIGPMGLRGPEGPIGMQGPAGPVGPKGSSIRMLGKLSSISSLPSGMNVSEGDMYIVNKTLYSYDGESYIDCGTIEGPQGIQGMQGPVGPRGPVGPQGPRGPVGYTGATGQPFIISGNVKTVLELPQNVAPGTMYSVGSNLYQYYNNTWSDLGKIIGPQGPQGPAGPIGPVGPRGEVGPRGIQGEPGKFQRASMQIMKNEATPYKYTLSNYKNGDLVDVYINGSVRFVDYTISSDGIITLNENAFLKPNSPLRVNINEVKYIDVVILKVVNGTDIGFDYRVIQGPQGPTGPIAEIVNNLNDMSTNKALSANMGNVILGKLNELASRISEIEKRYGINK